MQLVTFADIAGADSTVQIAPGSKLQVRFIKLAVLSAGSVTVRVGDVNTSISRGVALFSNPASGIFSGVLDIELDGADLTEEFAMAAIYAYVPSGATLTVTAACG